METYTAWATTPFRQYIERLSKRQPITLEQDVVISALCDVERSTYHTNKISTKDGALVVNRHKWNHQSMEGFGTIYDVTLNGKEVGSMESRFIGLFLQDYFDGQLSWLAPVGEVTNG